MPLLRALLRPLQPAALLTLVAAALLLALCDLSAGIVGVVIWVPRILICAVLLRYALIQLEETANGLREARPLEPEHLNVAAIGPLLLLSLVVLAWQLSALLGTAFGVGVRGLLLLLLPLVTGLLCVGARRLDAINPVVLGRAILALGLWYPLALAIVAGYLGLCTLALRAPLWPLLQYLVMIFCLFSAAALIGSLFHLRRLQLGFEPIYSPERSAQRADSERRLQFARFLDELYPSIRSRNYAGAQLILQRWLSSGDPARWQSEAPQVLEQARSWELPAARIYLADRFATALIQRQQLSGALDLLAPLCREGLAVRLSDATTTLALAQYAHAAGQRQLARALLEGFEGRFADSPHLREARHLQQELAG
ncbi:MAG: hypothetical protein QM718_01590 [Steroidobacteraceae bacterium]